MSLVGLDIGTTSCKAISFDTNGNILATTSREYSIEAPRVGWAEQDAEIVWKLAMEALNNTLSLSKNSPPVAMALSVQGEAIIPVDKSFNPMAPAILGMDTRTTKQNQWLEKNIGKEKLFELTGMPTHTINTLPKLLWIRENKKDIWNSAHKFLLYEDFFIARLTGKTSISHCLASRTQIYDIQKGHWSKEILEKCKIDVSLLSNLQDKSNSIVGETRAEITEFLNLEKPIQIITGGHDQACAALGCGVINNGQAMVSTGTAEVVEVVMSKPSLDSSLRDGGISVYRHVVPNQYLAMTLNHSGGILLRWFRDQLSQYEVEKCKGSDEDAYSLIFKDVPPGPTNLMVLPHFAGAGTPYLNTNSKGAILGLTLSDTKASIAKAILEGLTFELRINLELLKSAGIKISELNAVGGGSKSKLWLTLKADITNIPINVPKINDSACLGAAILAGVGANVFPNYNDAVNKMVHNEIKIIANKDISNIYNEKFNIYKKIYPTLVNLQNQF